MDTPHLELVQDWNESLVHILNSIRMRMRIFPCSVFAHRQNACPLRVLFHSRSCIANFTGLHGLRHNDSASSACCASAPPDRDLIKSLQLPRPRRLSPPLPDAHMFHAQIGPTLCVLWDHTMVIGRPTKTRCLRLYCRFGQWLLVCFNFPKPGSLYRVHSRHLA